MNWGLREWRLVLWRFERIGLATAFDDSVIVVFQQQWKSARPTSGSRPSNFVSKTLNVYMNITKTC